MEPCAIKNVVMVTQARDQFVGANALTVLRSLPRFVKNPNHTVVEPVTLRSMPVNIMDIIVRKMASSIIRNVGILSITSDVVFAALTVLTV